MYHARSERTDEAHWIPNGDRQFTWTQLRRICSSCRGKIPCVDAKLYKIAQRIARVDGGFKFTAVPELNRGAGAANDVRVG